MNMRFITEKSSSNVVVTDVFSKLVQDRIIFIDGDITDNLANSVISQLLYLDSLNKDEITIYINSYGGSVYDGLGIIDVMGLVKSPIKTVVLGKAMSMGALIFICGDKRQMTKRSTIMFHEISSGMHGKISDMVVSYKEVERLSKIVSKIVEFYTDVEDIDKAFQKDTYYDPTDALKLNITDEIL